MTPNVSLSLIKFAIFVFLVFGAFRADASTAANDDFGNVGGKLCQIVQAVTGRVGRAIATIAVVFLGIGAFFGKVTWGLAVAVSVGIFAIFGASQIVAQFNSGNGTC